MSTYTISFWNLQNSSFPPVVAKAHNLLGAMMILVKKEKALLDVYETGAGMKTKIVKDYQKYDNAIMWDKDGTLVPIIGVKIELDEK